MFKSTSQVADELNVPLRRLKYQIKAGKMAKPSLGEDGCFQWTAKDIADAKEALATDRRKRD